MKVISFLKSVQRVIRVSRKPNKTQIKLSLKISLLGLLLLGLSGYTIQLLATSLREYKLPPIPKEYLVYVSISMIVAILAILAYRMRKTT